MSSIKIICPGRVREKWMQQGIEEYIRRLSRYAKVAIIQVDDAPDSWPLEKALQAESGRILSKIKPGSYLVALDLNGIQTDSVQFSGLMQDWLRAGGSEIVFVIGGSNGLSREIINLAQQRLCLSMMTFTHQMTRLILLEQCYRAFRIYNNEPYHK
jgi:23S rRNA (pseudouridine1915-N3)-methyltransferase